MTESRTAPMNRYGALAQRHWRTHLPARYAAIEDTASFFADLGQQVSDQIASVELDLRGPDEPSAGFWTRAGTNNMARLQAEELVLHELVYLEPESGASPNENEAPEDSDELPPHWQIPTAQETVAAVIAQEEQIAT